jgi:hypothetical protein
VACGSVPGSDRWGPDSHAQTRANIVEALRWGIPIRAGIVKVVDGQDTATARDELLALGVTDIHTDRHGHGGVRLSARSRRRPPAHRMPARQPTATIVIHRGRPVDWTPNAERLASEVTHPVSRWRPVIAAISRHLFVPSW